MAMSTFLSLKNILINIIGFLHFSDDEETDDEKAADEEEHAYGDDSNIKRKSQAKSI